MIPQRFDVFLCHNSEDKSTIIQVAEQLQRYNLKPWLDQWELRPGTTWQLELERQIRMIPAAAVFVGKAGFGPWQREEIYSLLQQFVQRRCPVIPVLLPDAPRKPDLPIFLANRMWVDFRVAEPNPMYQLVWGVTGRKPAQNPTSQPKSPSSAQTNPQNLNANTNNLTPLGQPFANVWQSLGKQAERWSQRVDEYITSSLQEVDEGIAPPTTTRSPSSNPPPKSLPALNSSRFDAVAPKLSNTGNYTKLQNLLRAGKWKEANQETTNRLCNIMGRTQDGWLRVDDIKTISAEDLKIIDRLWMHYSQGKFGFSVQKRIWQECGSPVDFGEKWETFGDRLGWCINGKWLSTPLLICDLQNSPVGELPRLATNDVPVLMVRVLFKRFQS